jgi:hypothetical protein
MRFFALILMLVTLASPAVTAQTTTSSLVLALDDEIGRDWGNEDNDDSYQGPRGHDQDDRYNSDDDSANGPDDDGWDLDEYEHSEWA